MCSHHAMKNTNLFCNLQYIATAYCFFIVRHLVVWSSVEDNWQCGKDKETHDFYAVMNRTFIPIWWQNNYRQCSSCSSEKNVNSTNSSRKINDIESKLMRDSGMWWSSEMLFLSLLFFSFSKDALNWSKVTEKTSYKICLYQINQLSKNAE